MRFLITLWLFIFVSFSAFNNVHASQAIDLSFSVYLEINGRFIYPAGQIAEDINSKPFEMIVSVRGLTNQTLQRILLDFCLGNLEIGSVSTIQVNIDPLLKSGIVMTRVESYMTSSMASPTASESIHSLSKELDLLVLSKCELIEHIYENSLRVSIQSSTDSIHTVGYRLRQKELSLL
ncbi:hypothetical protein [Candidatus Bodocaedibacter vickermanii]|uniref:Uncharacterized protein n=1 Tax=Candidatus Bodocaedibacter vickermanii TaxID=2741701 RepID=A0A7L9RS21_9PROT|nr:hypothetical protein CPBP_00159 [Candidatus Paracaedibacteraceae bacterium 'Lake Konstanz']